MLCATIAHASNHCTIVAQFLTLSIPLCYNREEQDNPDAYRMLSSLLYGSDARRTKQGICFNTGRNKEVTEAAGVGGADYEAMSRAELVALAKERGIRANGKTVDIIKGLQELGAPGAAAPAPEEKDFRLSSIMG